VGTPGIPYRDPPLRAALRARLLSARVRSRRPASQHVPHPSHQQFPPIGNQFLPLRKSRHQVSANRKLISVSRKSCVSKFLVSGKSRQQVSVSRKPCLCVGLSVSLGVRCPSKFLSVRFVCLCQFVCFPGVSCPCQIAPPSQWSHPNQGCSGK
jgi:hypothetical protein